MSRHFYIKNVDYKVKKHNCSEHKTEMSHRMNLLIRFFFFFSPYDIGPMYIEIIEQNIKSVELTE